MRIRKMTKMFICSINIKMYKYHIFLILHDASFFFFLAFVIPLYMKLAMDGAILKN